LAANDYWRNTIGSISGGREFALAEGRQKRRTVGESRSEIWCFMLAEKALPALAEPNLRHSFDALPGSELKLMYIPFVSRVALIALPIFIAAPGVPATASVVVTIDKSTQRMKVEVDGALRWIWPVSTGQPAYDTPSGRYTAFRMEADHFSKEWDDAPMPSSIFFSPKGHAIHGYLNTRRIGTPASHGCVRLEPANAARLYALVEQQGLPNTKVVVTGDVRVALARRGMQWGHGADVDIGMGTALDGRSYGYWRRVDGYRVGPPRYPPAQAGYSYPPYRY
jgi:hypothetical protein